MKLTNQTQNKILAENVIEATSFIARSRGLLGRSSFPKTDTLWIHRCNSIHTFFMRFSIDIIFVDADLKVKKVYHRLTPGRVTFPIFSAQSVFEFAEGALEPNSVHQGDQLYVGG